MEVDRTREELFVHAQKPQDEENEEGGFAGPVKEPELNIDYKAFAKLNVDILPEVIDDNE